MHEFHQIQGALSKDHTNMIIVHEELDVTNQFLET